MYSYCFSNVFIMNHGCCACTMQKFILISFLILCCFYIEPHDAGVNHRLSIINVNKAS